MLFRLSRVSFWLAAAVAALALLAPGQHATLLTGIALAASTAAFGLWRSAVRTQQRTHRQVSAVPAPAVLTQAALSDAAAALARAVEEAASFEAALHAVARVLRGELGARQVAVCRVGHVDATHAELTDLIESQPGFQAVPRRVRLAGTLAGRALLDPVETGAAPGAIALPVRVDGRVVALIELTTLDVPVEPDALAGLIEQARAALAARAPDTPPSDLPWRSGEVLVVEDNVSQAEAIAAHLGRWGCRVTSTSGMLHAEKALCRTQFDLVFIDTRVLPTSDADALGRLRLELNTRNGNAGDVPMIAVTGPVGPGDGQRLRESGFDDHVSNPFGHHQMHNLLKRHLRPQAPAESHESVAPASVGASPVLDPAALARLTELDPSGENHLLERVLRAFQTSVARLRPQAEAARQQGDRAGLRLVAHTLKSSSASIGAMHLSQLCAQIETTIRLQPDEDLEPQLDALSEALDSVLGAIAQLLKERA